MGEHSDELFSQQSKDYHGVGIFLILLAPVFGAFIPFYFKTWTKTIHFMCAYAGGILLGFALLHTIPDAIQSVPPIDTTNEEGYPFATLLIGCTLLFLIFISTYVEYLGVSFTNCITGGKKAKNFSDSFIDGIAFWPGLAIHGIFEGLAFGIASGVFEEYISLVVLFLHKSIEFAALGSILAKIELSPLYFWLTVIACELPCLIAFCVAWCVTTSVNDGVDGYFAAFASGTFLYLSLGHLIPDAFNDGRKHGSHIHMEIQQAPSQDIENTTDTTFQHDNKLILSDSTKDSSNNHTLVVNENDRFMFKTRAMMGVGLGFASFALVELYSSHVGGGHSDHSTHSH